MALTAGARTGHALKGRKGVKGEVGTASEAPESTEVADMSDIAKVLQELADKHGVLTPDMVIEEAKNPDSPLHERFEWDVEKAAVEHWRDTARSIIRSVRIEYRVDNRKVSCVGYVRDPSAERGEQGYVPLAKLKSQDEAARDALAAEVRRIEAAVERAREIAMFLGMADELESVVSGLARFAEQIKLAA